MVKLYNLIVYSGIVGFIFLALGFIFGVWQINFRIHAILGILAFIFAAIHLGLIVYKNWKLKLSRKVK